MITFPHSTPLFGRSACWLIVSMLCCSMHADDGFTESTSRPLVIAHRGASGYLPEHSEGAKVLAFAQGADVIEQDVVLSRDEVFVVSHDITLEQTTNVSELFPNRNREDGRYYFADFDWSELRTLSIHERQLESAVSHRFPFRTDMKLTRLLDEIKLIQGLNRTLGKNVGFHIELKAPSWHLEQFGWHMGGRLVELLRREEVVPVAPPCFIQCFEAGELQYLRFELDCPYPLVQLLGDRPLGLVERDPNLDALAQIKAEIAKIAKYADGIGPSIQLLVRKGVDGLGVQSTGLVELAHQHKLLVHPYTVRADHLPEWCESVDELHAVLLKSLAVDGFFTDFPDLGRQAVDASLLAR